MTLAAGSDRLLGMNERVPCASSMGRKHDVGKTRRLDPKTGRPASLDIDGSVLGANKRIVLLDPIDGEFGLKTFGFDKCTCSDLAVANKASGRCK